MTITDGAPARARRSGRPPGVLVSTDDSGATWAWVGVEVVSVADLSQVKDQAALSADERLERAVQEQSLYLRGALAVPGAVVTLRMATDGRGKVSIHVLGRLCDGDPARARSRAVELCRVLSEVPRHVVVQPVTDEAALRAALRPFDVGPGGVAQVAKQVSIGLPTRPDAGVRRYLTVEPFARSRVSWTPLLESLRISPRPTAVSVDLEAARPPEELRRALEAEATRYRRLSNPYDRPLDLGGRQMLAADAGAAAVAPVYEDTLARLTRRLAWFSVTVSSSGPVDASFAEHVARTLSPAPRPRTPDVHDPQGLRTGSRVLRPRTDAEAADMARGLETLQPPVLPDPEFEAELAGDLLPGGPGPVRGPLRLLRQLVDDDETLSVFRLPVAVDGQAPGLVVSMLGDRSRRLVDTTVPSLLLGHQGTGTAGDEVRLPETDLPRHGFIVGTPGSGKTNTALHLCRQLWTRKIPFAVLEPVNSDLDDYRWLATLDGFEDLLVLTVGDESTSPLRLNPFQVSPGVSVAAHVSGLLASFEAAFGLWDPLPFLYRRALVETYRRRDLHPDDRGTIDRPRWPVLGEFVDCLDEVVQSLGYSGEVAANIHAGATLRAQSLSEGACGPVLDCRRSFDLSVLMRRPVVYELAAIGDNPKEQALVTLLLLNAMRGHFRRSRRPEEPAHVVLIEEAHRVFPRATAASPSGDVKEGNAAALAAERIAQGLAEDRKYRQSYVLVDQQVGKVAEDAYKITNLKIMHRTSAEEDRRLLGSTMSADEDQMRVAATLRPFQALVSHNRLDRPVVVTVPDVRAEAARRLGSPEAPLADDDDVAARHRRLLAEHPDMRDSMTPMPECAPCPAACRFRSRGVGISHDPRLVDQVLEALMDRSGSAHPDDDARASLLAVLPLPDGRQEPTGPSRSAVGYRLCAWIHAYRAAFPPREWDEAAEHVAQEWAMHVWNLLVKGKPS